LTARARRALSQLMILVGMIQFFDAILDRIEGRFILVPGVLVFGVVYLFAAAHLSGYFFWSSKAWQD
jgi:hypothetical protein